MSSLDMTKIEPFDGYFRIFDLIEIEEKPGVWVAKWEPRPERYKTKEEAELDRLRPK